MKRLVALAAGIAAAGMVVSMGTSPAAPDDSGFSLRQQMLRSAPNSVERGGGTDLRLTFRERNPMEVEIDNGAAGFSQGDEVAITSVLTRNGKRVGRFDGHAVATYVNFDAGRVRALLDATATLPDGEIEVQGVFTFSGNTADFSFGVVGGTRAYDDVGGTFHLVEDQNAVKFVFDLKHLD